MREFILTLEDFGLIKVEGGSVRDYFSPYVGTENQLVHDILDHPEIPHPNPYIDELMGIGGLMYRSECEGKPLTSERISKLVGGVVLCSERDGAAELSGVDGWIGKGYGMARSRYEGGVGVKVLGEGIVEGVRGWRKGAKVGDRFVLVTE